MSDLRDLYQQVIIDHGRHPRNFSVLENANHIKEGFNPLCGDKITLYVKIVDDLIVDIAFQGSGCAISMASASLMTEQLKGKRFEDMQALFSLFHQVVTGDMNRVDELGKLAVLAGVAEYPARVKCASLCWHTVKAALENSDKQVSTE